MVAWLTSSSRVAWLVPVGMCVHPVLQYGGGGQPGDLLIAGVMATLAYLLAIYLFYGISVLAYREQYRLVIGATVVSIVVAMMVTGMERPAEAFGGPVMIGLAGGISGLLIKRGRGPLRAYLFGFGVVAIVTVAVYATIWPAMMDMAAGLFEEMIEEWKAVWSSAGVAQVQINDLVLMTTKTARASVRLIPASMIMGAVVQFSVGFLLFVITTVANPDAIQAVKSFTRWKVPFGVTGAVIAAVPLRLLGGETSTLIADNTLLILAVYYGLGGLSLLEYGLKRIGVSLPIRVAFYVLLTFSGLIGFFVTAILGFIDSFTDWRKISSAEIDLKKG